MPAPSIIVTYTDQDGDEFPVRVPVSRSTPRSYVEREAQEVLDAAVVDGSLKPTMPVRLTGYQPA